MNFTGRFGLSIAVFAAFSVPLALQAQSAASSASSAVTFTKDVAPILQRACQNCHHPNSIGPMSLMTYEEVRPWARAIKSRITIGPHAGVMPPWFVEKDIG